MWSCVGGDTVLSDPQIITHPYAFFVKIMTQSFTVSSSDLGGKLFSRGNIQRTHSNLRMNTLATSSASLSKSQLPTVQSSLRIVQPQI